MDRSDLDALVLGAGVSGLTTAVCLVEAGLRVRIWTAEPPQQTTSAAAGAMWGPYLVEPRDRVRAWSDHTLKILRSLAGQPGTGVRLVAGVEASRTVVDPPDWGARLDGFRMCDPGELPDGFVTGWRYTAPVVDMPVYLDYLGGRFLAAGGSIEIRRVQSLDDTAAAAPVVINCTGLGAVDLVPDQTLTPIRGQLVVVENPGIDEFFSEDTGQSPQLLHYYPQGSLLVLGGTADVGEWSREPDPATADAIVERCAQLDSRIAAARIVDHRVGLRPTRPAIRVEREDGGSPLIHNYGHGGAGVTVSWGCAAEVVYLFRR